jgi:hypothetical protein
MGRRWRETLLLVALAVGVVVPVASGIAAVTQTSAVPAKLVGKWTRKVTSADVKRTGGYGVSAGTVCTLTVKRSGVAHLDCTNIGGFGGTIVPAGANRVHINLGIPSPDVYKWRVSGRLLTFTKVKDTVADREAAMEGVWKRK